MVNGKGGRLRCNFMVGAVGRRLISYWEEMYACCVSERLSLGWKYASDVLLGDPCGRNDPYLLVFKEGF